MKVVTKSAPDEPAVLVTVHRVRGSAPREEGAWMLVRARRIEGTVGGGHVELEAIAQAHALLASGQSDAKREWALGPSLGQCCGGTMQLRFERVDDASSLAARLAPTRAPLALFGGGHVGRAIVT